MLLILFCQPSTLETLKNATFSFRFKSKQYNKGEILLEFDASTKFDEVNQLVPEIKVPAKRRSTAKTKKKKSTQGKKSSSKKKTQR
jgi:hypothetical protein